MQFGNKFDRKSAEREGGGGTTVSTASIWNFQKGETAVRFLEDLDDWTEYWEHYDANAKKFFPCTGDRNECPGCVGKLRASQKWLVNAYVIETTAEKMEPGYVNLFKFPKSIMTKVMRHADKVGTLTEHDYTIIRMGDGMDTVYDLEREKGSDIDTDEKMQYLVDHQEALQASYDDYMNKETAESSEKPSKSEARAARTEDAPKKKGKKDKVKKGKQAKPEDPPSEPQSAEDDSAQTEEFTIDDVLRMEFDEVDALAKRAGLEVPNNFTEASEIANWLINEIAVDED